MLHTLNENIQIKNKNVLDVVNHPEKEKLQDVEQKGKKLEVTQKCDQHSVISSRKFLKNEDTEKTEHVELMLNQNSELSI
jgi:hypothetical protein